VLMELGGASDRLAIACQAYGAIVFRYRTFDLNPADVNAVVERFGWTLKDEKPRGTESGTDLSARKRRAYALLGLGATRVDNFVPVTDRDLSVLCISAAFRSFKRLQRRQIGTIQSLLAAYRDRALVELAFQRQTDAKAAHQSIYKTVVDELARDLLGGELSERGREDFVAAIGAKFPTGEIPLNASEEDIELIVEAIIESDTFEATVLDRLKALHKELERMIKGDKGATRGKAKREPVPAHFLWEHVFGPIDGVGVLIAAPLITEIGDIRNYESFAALKAAAGYHHFEDGSRSRRVAGKVSNWKPKLKQAVYQWGQQVVKMPGSDWRNRLDQRKAYELWKILYDKQMECEREGLHYMILDVTWMELNPKSVNDMNLADFAELSAIVDDLRQQAGVTIVADEEVAEDEDVAVVKDAVLGKLMAGVKGKAHNKALRWLGQQFLKLIYIEWRKALGIHDLGSTARATG